MFLVPVGERVRLTLAVWRLLWRGLGGVVHVKRGKRPHKDGMFILDPGNSRFDILPWATGDFFMNITAKFRLVDSLSFRSKLDLCSWTR